MDDLDEAKFCCLSSLNVSFSFLLFTQSSRVLRWLSGLGGTTGLAVDVGIGVGVVGAVVAAGVVGVAAFVIAVDGKAVPIGVGLLRTCKKMKVIIKSTIAARRSF